MKLTHFNLSFSLLIFLTISSLKAEDIKAQLPETKFLSYNIQDRPSPNIDNPLKGMSKFLFFPMSPAKDKAMADRANHTANLLAAVALTILTLILEDE